MLRVELPSEGRHPTNTYASASPSTDGEHIIAFFGSRGLYGLTMDGRVLWERDFGDMDGANATNRPPGQRRSSSRSAIECR